MNRIDNTIYHHIVIINLIHKLSVVTNYFTFHIQYVRCHFEEVK